METPCLEAGDTSNTRWHLCKQQGCRHRGCNADRQENTSTVQSRDSNRLQNKTGQDAVFMKKMKPQNACAHKYASNAETRGWGRACACALSGVRLCDPVDCSLPGSSVHGILQARILQRVAMPSSRGSSRPRGQTCVSCIGRWVLYH